MIIIGERINSSRKSIAAAIGGQDAEFIRNEVKIQDDAGAHYIDVNAAMFAGEEEKYLRWIIEQAEAVSALPLSIDSPDYKVIKAVLPMLQKPPVINSITLEPERMNNMLPLVKEYGTKVIGLCQSEDKLAETAEAKLAMAEKLVEAVTRTGIPLDDLYIDPLVYPLSTNTDAAGATLEAIGLIVSAFPGVHTTMGLTNVSHGLPMRKLVNRTFLVAAVARGLDSAIMDPTDKQLYGALKATLMVMGQDDFCMEFITAHREGRLEQWGMAEQFTKMLSPGNRPLRISGIVLRSC